MKDVTLTELYDIYGGLLTEKQRTVFELYYDEDLSLSEIAEHTKTTRQGVRDLIERAGEELKRFENVLSIHKKQVSVTKFLESNSEIGEELRTELFRILDL